MELEKQKVREIFAQAGMAKAELHRLTTHLSTIEDLAKACKIGELFTELYLSNSFITEFVKQRSQMGSEQAYMLANEASNKYTDHLETQIVKALQNNCDCRSET